MNQIASAAVLSLLLATSSGAALAHGSDAHGGSSAAKSSAPAEQKPFGIAAEPRLASRVVKIDMSDRMRFTPSELTVRQGETVRFVVHNSGKVMHELVLGTSEELKKHAEMMRKFPDMEHDEPHMVHVAPGKTGELVWTFNRAGEFEFACLIPGHFESGMTGRVRVTPSAALPGQTRR